MKAFILESEEETIAVIKLTDKDEFYGNVRLAIAEHYVCEHDEVSIIMSDEVSIVMSSVEQGDDCIRNYTLTETCVY